eukprot:gene19615-biopygen2512
MGACPFVNTGLSQRPPALTVWCGEGERPAVEDVEHLAHALWEGVAGAAGLATAVNGEQVYVAAAGCSRFLSTALCRAWCIL